MAGTEPVMIEITWKEFKEWKEQQNNMEDDTPIYGFQKGSKITFTFVIFRHDNQYKGKTV